MRPLLAAILLAISVVAALPLAMTAASAGMLLLGVGGGQGSANSVLREDGTHVLREDGSRICRESGC